MDAIKGDLIGKCLLMPVYGFLMYSTLMCPCPEVLDCQKVTFLALTIATLIFVVTRWYI